MGFNKFLLASAACVTLAACASTMTSSENEVSALNDATAVGSPFTQQLTAEYRAYSNYELQEAHDYADALHFARKGLETARGVEVMPEPTVDWDLNKQQIDELAMAYDRLINAFDRGSREILPGQSAIAQARYDCWVEEAEESNDEVPCKADFLAVMSELEAAMPVEQPAPVMAPEEFPAPVTMIDTNEPLNVEEAVYLVFFDFDSSTVDQGGMNVLDTVVNEVQTRNIEEITIVGHTDTSGSKSYNERLAKRRADGVKARLVASGIPAENISTEARGESELLVETQDNIREPANRRAVITFGEK